MGSKTRLSLISSLVLGLLAFIFLPRLLLYGIGCRLWPDFPFGGIAACLEISVLLFFLALARELNGFFRQRPALIGKMPLPLFALTCIRLFICLGEQGPFLNGARARLQHAIDPRHGQRLGRI
jgi:hypothetical protein